MLVNGRVPHIDELATLGQLNYGHFTTMQVRDRRARGFDLHLRRLADATHAMFGSELDVGQVRAWARECIDDAPVTLRITVFSKAFDRANPDRPMAVDVLMATRAPGKPRSKPLRLRSVEHERVLPHIKHIGTLDLLHHARQARIAGFDDVVFATRENEISEGSTWNIGFWDGQRVIWPAAPALFGITRQLLDAGLQAQGIETVVRPVRLGHLADYQNAFILNSGSIGPMIESINSHRYEIDDDLMHLLSRAHDTQPKESI